VDWHKLAATVRLGVRFLDDVIEINKYPLPEVEHAARASRKIGLGVMGFAELLIRLGISYDSAQAVEFAERLMGFIDEEAMKASQALAGERGVFPNWERSTFAARGLKLRNATCTAIAPTGTIGIIADTTPGIEPLFALAYRRTNVLDGQTLTEVNPLLLEHLERRGLDAKFVVKEILASGRLQDAREVPDDLKSLFITALDIAPDRHLQIQAAFQRHVDNSVSKTINLPQDATEQDVEHAYLRAWELGLKGITIYRYGSKASQVLELGAGETAGPPGHSSRCDPDECRV
ncbi:MAG TPA: ribonucleotide-diphosphate reductase subunit alpha, partial [Verrucomicrobiae bacterium]